MRRGGLSLDGAALGLSGLCLIHCLALPLAAAALPLLGAWSDAEWVHGVILFAAAPLAAGALLRPGHGLRPAGRLMALAAGGIVLLALGAFGPAQCEVVATLAGSALLATAHILNWRRRARRARAIAGAAAWREESREGPNPLKRQPPSARLAAATEGPRSTLSGTSSPVPIQRVGPQG